VYLSYDIIDSCTKMVNGYVENAILTRSSNTSAYIDIQTNKWNFLKIVVREECNKCMNVDGFINGCQVFSFQSHFNTRGFGGGLAENGHNNVVEFRKFDIDPIIHSLCPDTSLHVKNDCSSCQGGSSGACLPDRVDCQHPTFPWKILCKAVYDVVPDGTKNKFWEEAGKDGCFSCGSTTYISFLRSQCATTCNWCTNSSITTTSSTITSTSTTTTETKQNRLVAIGGSNRSGYLSSVEVVEVEKNIRCNIASFPYGLYEHSATIIPTGILVCGGWALSLNNLRLGDLNRCYEYKTTTSSWQPFPSMTTSRRFFDMKFLNQGIWAIGGVVESGFENKLDNFDFHTNVWTTHDIPIDVTNHCLSKIAPDKLIIIAGRQNGSVSSASWIFDTRTKTWTHGPRMRARREKHGCFSIEENGRVTKIVAMGGFGNGYLSSAEILNVTSMQWENLPDLPFGVVGHKGVESDIGPYLGFSVTGYRGSAVSRGTFERRIYALGKNESGYYWEEVKGLTTSRLYSAVVNVPMSIVPSC